MIRSPAARTLPSDDPRGHARRIRGEEQRYGGWLSLAAPYEAGDPAEISYHVTLNPTDTELAPPS